MNAKDLACSTCGSTSGTFKVEDDELVLHFRCGHETAGLVMNLDLIGEENSADLN